MEWDQKAFLWLWRAWRTRWKGSRAAPLAECEGDLPALEAFATLVAGRPVRLVGTRGVGGRQGDLFRLPFSRALFPDPSENLDFFRLRILLMSADRALDMPAANSEITTDDPGRLFRRSLRRVLAEYPLGRALFTRVKANLLREEAIDRTEPPRRRRALRAQLIGSLPAPSSAKIELDSPPDEHELQGKTGEELEIEALEDAELLEPDKKQIEDYTLGHNFEKIETLDEFNGNWRDLDQEDDLKEKQDALNELKFKHRVRTAEQAQAVLSAEVAPSSVGDSQGDDRRVGPALYFDEWDDARRRYRRDFCRVFLRQFRARRTGFAAEVLRERRLAFESIERRLRRAFQEREQTRRQTGGEEPDFEALVAAHADLRAGRTPDERLYLSRRRRRHDLRLSFLMDLSLSTDAYVAGRRALDIEREALLIFGEALSRQAIPFSVSGFFSRTRNECDFVDIIGDSEDWARGRDRLGALQPRGYTRIGPALRRAVQVLKTRPERQRWIVMFTDGKPNDYDRYEGRYGVRDVRQAVREAVAEGIHVQAFAIDRGGRPAFREMLGESCYRVLSDPDRLPDALGDFFLRII